ncbi:MAG: Plug domain-containing protein, partial [Bacteroidales bacterium]|nr:Plug domain-containing protein [Bacteroidales bacterium]
VKCDEGLSNFSFEFPHDQKQRVMLLDATYENNPFRQYIRIPFPDDDFDVSFYPEGGSVLYGTTGRIAFKALQRDGTEIDVSGEVYDSRGNEITRFKTDVRGMGQFMMKQEPGETYDAVCTNSKGESRRFRLPAAQNTGYVLSATWGREHLKVNVLQPESQKTGDTLCLIVHTRGIVQDARIWENTSEPLVFPKDFFLSGVSHLLLLTKEMVPVSERLVFVHNDDQAKVEGKTGRGSYPVRTPVEYTVHITDETGEPLIGNFSVSVTDGHEVTVDTTMNISTTLLLTSDLRGNIPDPGYYFREKGHLSVYSLDLLMQTQGWRRYDTERIIKNDLLYPDTLLQKGYVVSGTVRNRNRPVDGALVNILAIHGNYTGMSYTDRNGRFYLSNGDLPDSTAFIVQATSQGKNQNLELILDGVSYPERKIPVVAPGLPDRGMFAKYAGKAEQQYVDEHGVRISHIPEVTITASKIKGKDYSFFYKARDAQFVISEDDLKRNPPASINSLLNRIPGIFIAANTRSVTYGHSPVYFVVDDRLADDVFDLSPADIAQVDLLSGSAAATFVIPHPKRYDGDYSDLGQPSPSHVISITTRRGTFNAKETPYIKPVIPLGFQKPVEFYAPKYDTSTGNPKPDLRTTIHWQPNITTDEYGKASFSFYTADTPSTYTVVIEGMTEDGKMIYKRDQIVVENQ